MRCNTPIVFLIFRRPDLTAQVFETIRQAQPKKLLVVADGPRDENESKLCQQAREATEQIDWDCEVLRNYSDVNLGCRKRVSSGLDWAFEQVEEAIILEDDCLPSLSFFHFCEVLLERYRHDERIMMISGDNFQGGQSRTNYSYYFSKYSHIWGWASWRRAWQHYDVEMRTWPEYKRLGLIRSVCNCPHEQSYWTNIFDNAYKGLVDTWDYQWLYTCWSQSALSILPNQNLVSNIGFGTDGTHTTKRSFLAELPTHDIWEVKYPPFVVRNLQADDYTFLEHYGGRYAQSTILRLRQKTKAVSKNMKGFIMRSSENNNEV